MAEKEYGKIGGWLLVYVIWAAVCIAFAVYSNVNGLVFYYRTLPEIVAAGWVVLLIVLIFYGLYSWFLYLLICRKSGIIHKIKLMILLTPVVNLVLPGIFAGIAAIAVPKLDFGRLLADSYSGPVLGSIVGGIVVAAIWFYYFRMSKRVKTIWPDEA